MWGKLRKEVIKKTGFKRDKHTFCKKDLGGKMHLHTPCEKRPIKNYHYQNGVWIVSKLRNRKKIIQQKYNTEEEAQKAVELYRECNWDTTRAEEIRQKVIKWYQTM